MREAIKHQLEILTNTDCNTLKREVNKFFCKHYHAQSIKTEYAVDNGNFIAFIEYGEKTLVPESAKDEYQLRGEEYRCGACPFWGGNVADTKEIFSCTKKQRDSSVISTTKCCGPFYEWLKEGVVELV